MLFTRSFGALRARDMLFRFKTDRDRERESYGDLQYTDENATRTGTEESAA